MAIDAASLIVRIGADANQLVSELGRSKTSLGKFGDQAKAAAKSAAQIGAAVAAAGAVVFAFTKRMANAGDEVAKTSRRLGLTTEGLSELRHAAELSGVKVTTLDMAMQRFGRRTAEAARGTGEAEGALKELGIQLLDGNGRLKSSDILLGEVADAFKGVGSESDRVRLAMKLFDSEGVALINMLEGGKKGLDDMRQAARDAGNVWSEKAARDAEEFTNNLTQLEGIVEGLSIQLAGPLIKALGDASGAMLEAQKRSESFFATLAAGFRSILTGDDATKWNRQFVNATDTLLNAQNELDRARHAVRTGAASGVSASIDLLEKRLADAQAEVNRLLGIRDIIAPEPSEKKPERDRVGPSVAAIDEEKEREKELAEWRREQAEKLGFDLRDINIAIGERKREERLKEIEEEKEREKELAEWRREQAEKLGFDLLDIEGVSGQRRREQGDAQREAEKRAQADFMNDLAGLMNTGSKKVFEIGKVASLAQAGIKGASAVMSAWEAGMSVGGPFAPLVAAAYAAAAGLNALNLMNNIRSQQFGGGGGAPVHPTQGASGVSPVGAGGGGQAQRDRSVTHTTVVLPAADLTSTSAVRQLLLGLTEEIEANGGRLSIQGG